MRKIIFLLTLLVIGLNTKCFAVTEFVTTCNKAGEHFNTITLWEDSMDVAGDLTNGTVKTGDWDNQVGVNISSNTAVTWDAGVSNGQLVFQTATQYLIDVTEGTLENNDVVSDGTGNTFDVNGVPDSAIVTLEIYNDDGDLSENGVTVDGFTTNATNYCKITVPEAERHDGTAGTGACIDGGGVDTHIITLYDNYIQIEWLEFKNWGNNSGTCYAVYCDNVSAADRNCTIKNCIIYDSGGVNDDAVRVRYAYNNKVINCIVYDCGKGFSATNAGSYTNYFYNCSYYGTGAESGFSKWGSSITCTNCCSFNGDVDFEDDGDTGSIILNNCISDDSTSDNFLGSNNLVDKVATDNYTNVGAGTEDLHLKEGADCIDAGQDLSGTFTDDIDGVTRSGTWDVGADEYVTGVGVDDGSRNYFYTK
ncbi:hypothetical protein KAR91_18550 [Candidatus Pacearchaeota archaeon]|nr:hypothetical protein [Candidatus Pacearchaeota archaeon]